MNRKLWHLASAFCLLLALILASCAGYKNTPIPSDGAVIKASWYGSKFHGRTTASGVPYNMYDMTAAHRTLPFGTQLEVTNLANNRRVVVTINDRGPYVGDRELDVSYAAAQKLEMIGPGTARVHVRILKGGNMPTVSPSNPPTTPASVGATTTPTASQPTLPGTSYTVQAGSFSSAVSAQKQAAQVETLCPGTYVESVIINGTTYHRVNAGRFTSREQAESAAQKLTISGLPAKVVPLQ